MFLCGYPSLQIQLASCETLVGIEGCTGERKSIDGILDCAFEGIESKGRQSAEGSESYRSGSSA